MNRSLFESLEGRRLLTAADLSATFTSTTLPASLLAGVAAKPAVAVVNVTNASDPLPKNQSGNVTVTVNLRDSEGGLHAVGSQNVAAKKLGKATVKLKVPANLAAGDYRLVLTVDGGAAITDPNPENNTVATDRIVTIAPSNMDVELKGSTTLSGSVASGASGTFTGTLTNNGNVNAVSTTGKVEITATVSGVTTVLATIPVKLNLKPGAKIPLKATKFTVAGTSGGNASVELGARFVATPSLSGDDASDNTISLGTLTVTPAPAGALDVIHLGSKITFKKTQGAGHAGVGFESGNWTDDTGHSGTFYFTTAGTSQGLLGLKDPGGTPLALITVTANSGIPSIGSSRFKFGVAQGASIGNWLVAGQTIYFAKG